MSPFTVDTPFGIGLDFSFWQWLFLELPPMETVRLIFVIIGWAIVGLVFFFMGAELWVAYKQAKYIAKWQWVVLAVDVPLSIVQTPKAVEQVFAQLSGAHTTPNIGQKYWIGKKQKWFSFEVISIGGYIQFLIRTEAEYRDLVEAAIYAQYSGAEITEVEDYVNAIPNAYPDSEQDVFGVEFGLAENEAYPIRVYEEFISKGFMSKELELGFSDPMAAILENFSRIGQGENLWMQIIIEPTDSKWKEKGLAMVKKMLGQTIAQGSTVISKIGNLPLSMLESSFDALGIRPISEDADKKDEAKVLASLTPGQRGSLEAIEEKISKIGFKTKMRVLYAARKSTYNPSKCIDGFVGAINQFHALNHNAIIPRKATSTHYAFKGVRLGMMKTMFVGAFKNRRMKAGGPPYIFNIEELATIWHFPMPTVKTPLLKKAIKQVEPPIDLPIGAAAELAITQEQESYTKKDEIPPEELPYA